ncbi:MAG: hypothetical protein JHC82_12645 [Stenotrophomonas sp.]|jgi:chitinase|nr:hypothetical protein [Stenotrophomonas sp.]
MHDPVARSAARSVRLAQPRRAMLLALAANSVELSWNAATDNAGGSGVAGHDVYRNGALVGCRDRSLLTGGGTASG